MRIDFTHLTAPKKCKQIRFCLHTKKHPLARINTGFLPPLGEILYPPISSRGYSAPYGRAWPPELALVTACFRFARNGCTREQARAFFVFDRIKEIISLTYTLSCRNYSNPASPYRPPRKSASRLPFRLVILMEQNRHEMIFLSSFGSPGLASAAIYKTITADLYSPVSMSAHMTDKRSPFLIRSPQRTRSSSRSKRA